MREVSLAYDLLPGWVGVVHWLWGPLVGLIGYWVLRLVLPREFPDKAHWSEHARGVYTYRMLSTQVFIAAVLSILVIVFADQLRVFSTHRGVWPAFTMSTALMGPILGRRRFDKRVRKIVPKSGVRSTLTTLIVFFAPLLLIVVMGAWGLATSKPLSWTSLVPGILTMVFASGGGLLLAVKLGLVSPARERVRLAVERTAQRLNIKYHGVYELDLAMANAFAFPLTKRLGVTSALVEVLSDDELEAVLSHEFGHLSEPRIVSYTRVLMVVFLGVMLSAIPFWSRLASGGKFAVVGVILLVFVFYRKMAARGEKHADSVATDQQGVYARALEKIYEVNNVPAVLPRAGAHGHLYDRLVATGSTPNWPRPKPPAKAPLRVRGSVLFFSYLPFVLWFIGSLGVTNSPDVTRLRFASGRFDAWDFEVFARDAADHQRYREALVHYRAAQALAPQQGFFYSGEVVVLANQGNCPEAITVWQQSLRYTSTDENDVRAAESARRAISGCFPIDPD